MPSRQIPTLIIGAGPTGLVLALSLARRGIALRIIDAGDGPGARSRAMAVQARTLEFYRQFGFAHEVVQAGVVARTVHLRRHGRDGEGHGALALSLEEMGAGQSPYPFTLTYPQDDHERLLVEKLKALGVAIEWRTRLTGFEEEGRGVRAELERGGRSERVDAQYIVGCDGARSAVREALGTGFGGGTYEQLFYVADVRIAGGSSTDIVANLGARSLVMVLPVRSSGMHRLIGLVPASLKGRENVTFEDLRPGIEQLAGIRVTEVNWFSTYRVHHRVADRFRVGRAFIAGDAAHIHSPAGGQGMNTGIGDAINLGWKLADVLRGRMRARVLETFEAERLPFARKLVSTTDRVFQALISQGFRGELTRTLLAPTVLAAASRFTAGRRMAFRTISQIAISYPESPLSAGHAGVRGGDRLPFAPMGGAAGGEDNFAPLGSLDWQVHVYGDPGPDLESACRSQGAALHVFGWNDAARRSNLKRNAAYLVRPDGYIALAAAHDGARRLAEHVQRIGLSLADPPAPGGA